MALSQKKTDKYNIHHTQHSKRQEASRMLYVYAQQSNQLASFLGASFSLIRAARPVRLRR